MRRYSNTNLDVYIAVPVSLTFCEPKPVYISGVWISDTTTDDTNLKYNICRPSINPSYSLLTRYLGFLCSLFIYRNI